MRAHVGQFLVRLHRRWMQMARNRARAKDRWNCLRDRNPALYTGRTTYSILETIKRIAESGSCDDVNITNTEYWTILLTEMRQRCRKTVAISLPLTLHTWYARQKKSRERHFTQHLKHPTSLNKTTRARRSRLFGVKERFRVCRVCCASSGGRLGERMREKERGRLPVAESTSTMTTVVVVENGFTLAASSKCSGTRGVLCFRLSGQTKGACAPVDRRRLGVRRDGTLTV